MEPPKRFPFSFDDLWKMTCAEVNRLGLRHEPTVQSKANPVYFVKLNCTCPEALK